MTLLDEIRARVASATEGPWRYDDGENASSKGIKEIGFPYARHMRVHGPRVNIDSSADPSWVEGDIKFIAHARQDIPFLLSELDALREEYEDLKQAWVALYQEERG